MAKETKATLEATSLDVVADRGYFNSEEILACKEAGITVTLPKPMTSNSKAEGRFGKQDFRYVAEEDVYICPAGERPAYHYTNEENGMVLRRYWTNACQSAPSSPAARPTAHGGNEGIVVADMRPSAVAEPPKTVAVRFRSTSRPKEPPNSKK